MRLPLPCLCRIAAIALVPLAPLWTGCDDALPTGPRNSQEGCLAPAVFPDPAASAWGLPYPVGAAYAVTQRYCNPRGGHRDTFAHDFDLPMGAPVTAARAGEVILANDQYADSDLTEGHENNVFVVHSSCQAGWNSHADGTAVRYTHLMQGSVEVAVSERVFAGQLLDASGASGNTGGVPHLHFEAFASSDSFSKSNAVPVNFRNAQGPLDDRGGLQAGVAYLALDS